MRVAIVQLSWDFARAKFTSNSAEPDSCFYVAISSNSYIEFLLGDHLPNEAGASREYAVPSVLSRREHVFGGKSSSTYSTRAQFLGSKHEIGIECSGGELKVKVDGKVGLLVKRLGWKFRGNEKIVVGGSDVEFYWDVYNWIVSGGGGGGGHGVFVFQVGDGGVWPEIAGLEKRLMRKTMLLSPSSACSPSSMVSKSSTWSSSCSSVLQWAEESNDGGRSSCASSRSCGSNGGFSLLLYAWKSD
ncbi:hypothetical protein Sjap_006557 [Stephania japonica]|uniref:Uncharacterized protein n=1 Tax=Stephania japonica TaxID=461633 RepID=A0AAP0K7N2_9MAGN